MLSINGDVTLEVTGAWPPTTVADAGKTIRVKADGSGYELHTPSIITPHALNGYVNADVVRDGVTDNSEAIQDALDYAEGNYGGIVQLPPGQIRHDLKLKVSPLCILAGAGMGTVLRFHPLSAGQTAIQFGPDVANALQYGMGLRDIDLMMDVPGSTMLKMVGTVGVDVRNVFAEAAVPKMNLIGLVIDGSNCSSFFNHLTNVQFHHVHFGVKFTTTGSQPCTEQHLDSVRVVGDSKGEAPTGGDLTGAAYYFEGANCGEGTLINGGRSENNMTGIYVKPGRQVRGVRIVGVEFETETAYAYDVDLSVQAESFAFLGNTFRKPVTAPSATHKFFCNIGRANTA